MYWSIFYFLEDSFDFVLSSLVLYQGLHETPDNLRGPKTVLFATIAFSDQDLIVIDLERFSQPRTF